jgi:hypothetical protein
MVEERGCTKMSRGTLSPENCRHFIENSRMYNNFIAGYFAN